MKLWESSFEYRVEEMKRIIETGDKYEIYKLFVLQKENGEIELKAQVREK